MTEPHPLLSKLGITKAEAEDEKIPSFDADLVPELPASPGHDTELDLFMDGISIETAYTRWCGKSEIRGAERRTEGIKVSCPNPNHPDKNPSAWLNTEKDVYFCGACQEGGDKYDIAAMHFGFDLSTYKDKEHFPKLVSQMAADLGYVVKKTASGTEYLEAVVVEVEDAEEPGGATAPAPVAAVVEPVSPGTDDEASSVATPPPPLPTMDDTFFFDWETVFKPDTFLYTWMEATTIDDLPHEYYAALGFMSIASAVGRNVYMADFKNVLLNMYCCLYGPTSSGKSRAMMPFFELMREVCPWDPADMFSDPSGVQLAPSPVSAEAMLDLFQHEVQNSSTMATDHYASINGVVTIDELSEFVARAQRLGSSLREVSMALFDGHEEVKTKSLSGGLRVAHRPFCQMLTSTQPNATREFLTRRDEFSGFLNRWMVFYGRPRSKPISYGGITPDLTGPIHQLRTIRSWADAEHRYTLEKDAYDAWDEFFQTHIAPLKHESRPILGRIDLMLKKLICIFAANECADNPTAEHVQMATSMFDYLTANMKLFSADVKSSDYEECWAFLLDTIQMYEAKGTAPTRRQINNSVKERFPAALVTQTMMDMLKSEFLLEETVKPKRGPMTVRYKLSA